ncbi:MAG: hypothetical protein DLM66_13165 [Candidatus Dormiibacter spiritus]|nr:MAG: hypothetical protein DLM66_13165 [Candidatus Dormibacteraeota bacterium]
MAGRGGGRATYPHRRQSGLRLPGSLTSPAIVDVVTFGQDHPGAVPARRFYEKLGFFCLGPSSPGPEGTARDRFRLNLVAEQSDG